MRKFILASALIILTAIGMFAQENQVKRIPGVGYDPNQQQYTTFGRGVWFATEITGGISCHHTGHNLGFGEANVTVGYRFSQYLKLGIGVGARYYIDQSYRRHSSIKWGMPLFVAVRGNLMPGLYRTVVPYYMCEVGGSIRDGYMLRPGLGIRIGEMRQAFTIGINYMGQQLRPIDGDGKISSKYSNFVALRLGYEF